MLMAAVSDSSTVVNIDDSTHSCVHRRSVSATHMASQGRGDKSNRRQDVLGRI